MSASDISKFVCTWFGLGSVPYWPRHWSALSVIVIINIAFLTIVPEYASLPECAAIGVWIFIAGFAISCPFLFSYISNQGRRDFISVDAAFSGCIFTSLSVPIYVKNLHFLSEWFGGLISGLSPAFSWFESALFYFLAQLGPFLIYCFFDETEVWPGWWLRHYYDNPFSNYGASISSVLYALLATYIISFIFFGLSASYVSSFFGGMKYFLLSNVSDFTSVLAGMMNLGSISNFFK